LRIAIDAMGGDKAPLETVKGAIEAARKYGVESISSARLTSSKQS
jgi:fatty acid/phospholipid biosynthesis enzyme